MFEVYILTPYVSRLCVATFSRVLTSLSLGLVRDYGLHIVTTRPKSKRCMRLHPEQALAVSPCPASSTKCHPKHGVDELNMVRQEPLGNPCLVGRTHFKAVGASVPRSVESTGSTLDSVGDTDCPDGHI